MIQWRIEVFCVRCGTTNAHPAVVEEARQHHHGEELVLNGETIEIWDLCPRCVELLERPAD
jgi:hypothetical protein